MSSQYDPYTFCVPNVPTESNSVIHDGTTVFTHYTLCANTVPTSATQKAPRAKSMHPKNSYTLVPIHPRLVHIRNNVPSVYSQYAYRLHKIPWFPPVCPKCFHSMCKMPTESPQYDHSVQNTAQLSNSVRTLSALYYHCPHCFFTVCQQCSHNFLNIIWPIFTKIAQNLPTIFSHDAVCMSNIP